MMKGRLVLALAVFVFLCFAHCGAAMIAPRGVDMECIGTIRPHAVSQIRGSNWTLGCETLDRDFADFEAYKEYLAPLGIKTIRLQAGWAKCEREKGRYDFAWLDKIVDYAVETTPVSRGFTKMGLIGFAVGFVLSLVVIFLVDFYISDTFQDSDALKQCLPDDIPVLSVIPDTDTSNTGKYGYYKKYGHYSNDYTYSYYQETVENEEAEKKERE